MSIPGAHGLRSQLLEQRQGFGQLLGLILEVVDLLCHGVNLLHNIYPE